MAHCRNVLQQCRATNGALLGDGARQVGRGHENRDDHGPAFRKDQCCLPHQETGRGAHVSHLLLLNPFYADLCPHSSRPCLIQMLEFIWSQLSVVERLLQHIETPAFSDLLLRIIQLDEQSAGAGVLEVCPSTRPVLSRPIPTTTQLLPCSQTHIFFSTWLLLYQAP